MAKNVTLARGMAPSAAPSSAATAPDAPTFAIPMSGASTTSAAALTSPPSRNRAGTSSAGRKARASGGPSAAASSIVSARCSALPCMTIEVNGVTQAGASAGIRASERSWPWPSSSAPSPGSQNTSVARRPGCAISAGHQPVLLRVAAEADRAVDLEREAAGLEEEVHGDAERHREEGGDGAEQAVAAARPAHRRH